MQTVPADASHPQMVIHSDKPLTPEEEANMKAQMDAMRKLPPANPLVPGFEIESADGKKISLAGLHGKVVLLDYWATWCAPCVEGLPELDAVYRKYRDNPNVAILAVNPLMGDTPEKAQGFFQQKRLTVPLAYDKRFGQAAVPRKGSKPTAAFSLPVVLLLDREGKQQWFDTGGEVGDTEHTMQKLLIAKIDAQLKRP